MLVTQCMLFGGRVVSIVALHQAYVFSDVYKTSVMSMTKNDRLQDAMHSDL